MDLSEDKLQEIETHAANLMSLDEIAEIIEVDVEKLHSEYVKGGDVYKRYRKGFLLSKSQLNKSAKDQAIAGSSPAMGQVLKILEKLYFEEIKRNQ